MSIAFVFAGLVAATRTGGFRPEGLSEASIAILEEAQRGGGEAAVATTDTPDELVEVQAGCDTIGLVASNGNVLPQIKRPWGFNDWVPQTNRESRDMWWFLRKDTKFYGLRCTHQPSPWMGDYTPFLVQPHTGDEPLPFRYSSDEAVFRPHYFNATLHPTSESHGTSPIHLEFAPTSRAGIMRLHFTDPSSPARVSLTVAQNRHDDPVWEADDDGIISGISTKCAHQPTKHWKGMFFVMKPLSPVKKVTVFRAGDHREYGKRSASPPRGMVEFESAKEPVSIAFATSFISKEQALLNLELEIGSKSFDEIVDEGQQEWRSLLSRTKVHSMGAEQLRLFYTNLWRAQLFPRYLHELNRDGEAYHYNTYKGTVVKGRVVGDSGFWDSYKTVYVLQSIIAPDNMGATIDGWVNAASDRSGFLPQWPSPDEAPMMVGTMGDVVLADAIVKKSWGLLEGFDEKAAYKAIHTDAFESWRDHTDALGLLGRFGLDRYLELGYVPQEIEPESVALTLGYYYADATIANAARALGEHSDAEQLLNRSKAYKQLFNDDTKFFQPKNLNGSFQTGFDDIAWRNGFTEGNAWHFRFDVPHDVAGLSELYGGRLCDAIQSMMTYGANNASEEIYRYGGYGALKKEMTEAANIAGEFGQYAHSNQPVHHVLYIAKKAGCNEIGDKYLRRVMQKLYTLSGWSGDEDNGEMAAWYVLSALGIYQLEGGRDEVVLGSPQVVSASVGLAHGKELLIKTESQSDENVYVQRIDWAPAGSAAREIKENVLKFTELMGGGSLTFTMGPFPKVEVDSM